MGCGIAKKHVFVLRVITQKFFLNRVHPHPSYDYDSDNYDVIVFKLQRKVDYGVLPNVYPACWPTLEPTTAGTIVRVTFNFHCHTFSKFRHLSHKATVSGFGTTSEGGSSSNTLKKVYFLT